MVIESTGMVEPTGSKHSVFGIKDDNKVTRRTTLKPVKRRRQKKNRLPSALARSRKRHAPFLEIWLCQKRTSTIRNSVCVKELENTSLACGSNSDLVSLENPTPSPAADPDLLNEQAILHEFLHTIDSDDSSGVLMIGWYCNFPTPLLM